LLREIVLTDLPAALLCRLTTGTRKENSKGKRLISVIGLAMFQEGLSDQFKWLDARDLHDSSTSQIRKMLTDKYTGLHVSIAKWEERQTGDTRGKGRGTPCGDPTGHLARIFFSSR
jgi:hypothetical protein